MDGRVAIIGAGISGMTLALRLQQLGVPTTLWSATTPEELRASRVTCFVARFRATIEREQVLGVDHWAAVPGYTSERMRLDVVGTPLGFEGRPTHPVRAVDFRLYLSQLLEDYVDRGGDVVVGPLPSTLDDVVDRTHGCDAVVVAAGRACELFPVRRDRSPFTTPQRLLLGGLFEGVRQTEPVSFSFNVVPGAGEIFQQAFLTERGVVSAMLVEAIPGGVLEPITALDVVHDATAFADAIERHAPALAPQLDRRRFRALGERHVLRGAVTPAVRESSLALPDGRVALAIGDAWITNDPITGQGANLGSHCAWHLADALATCDAADLDFAARAGDELWAHAGPITAWTNAFLQPPPPHVMEVLAAATADQAVADRFTDGFADPLTFALSFLGAAEAA